MKVGVKEHNPSHPGWHRIFTAPSDRDLELAVIEEGEVDALVFPCLRTSGGWKHARTNERVEVYPTHWREWRATH